MSNNDLEVYVYEGNEGEEVPTTVQHLIVKDGVRILPDELCPFYTYDYDRLRKVTFPDGLIRIGKDAFHACYYLLEISKIPRTVEVIGEGAFYRCSLTEANLSTTCVEEIPRSTFFMCDSLQTASLPNTLERICERAFDGCVQLVTVVLPIDSKPITIGVFSFSGCERLANLVLSRGSIAEDYEEDAEPFYGCTILSDLFGTETDMIIAGLIGRFDGFSIHKMCYDHSASTVEGLRHCIHQEESTLVDGFGMTPFHIFFSTIDPREEMLDILLDSVPNHILIYKDANDMRPLDYLINNWSEGTKNLLHRTLQKWMIDRVARWGFTPWKEGVQSKLQELLAVGDKAHRGFLLDEAYSRLGHYENLEATSTLEMALWKWKIKSGWIGDGTKRQALDREQCRCVSGSDVVMANVLKFLDITRASSQGD